MNDVAYFMNMARSASMKSKDESTKVGAVIVDKQKRIISTGFNGMVAGCKESALWEPREMKLSVVIHAEINAILYSHRNLKDHVMYCTHAPCINCLKHSLQAGIQHIYYEDSSIMKRTKFEDNVAVMRLIEATGASIRSTTTLLPYEMEIANFHATKTSVDDISFT
jgi:dCMP deaminase